MRLSPAVGVDHLVIRSPEERGSATSSDLAVVLRSLGVPAADKVGRRDIHLRTLILGAEAPSDGVGVGGGVPAAEALVVGAVEGERIQVAMGGNVGSQKGGSEHEIARHGGRIDVEVESGFVKSVCMLEIMKEIYLSKVILE